ncbi:MAG: ABC transporter substrate-binding protein [Campylobacteraceae bacterium]|jgi:NitT/TauT family transport system substrate-binding protein|nr:ABC transporter substrate-binding protein [Campylobacteraceae bacterium]
MKRVVLAVLLFMFFAMEAFGETKEIRISKQYGLGYLSFLVLEEFKIFEKNAKKAGLGDISVKWFTFAGGAATNEALLSGAIDFNANGVAPFLVLWNKTNGKVKALSAYDRSRYLLNTSNPNVKTLKDFTDNDKIALPAVKVSMQALILQMAAAKEFGIENYDKLDHLSVGLKHPDAFVALTSGKSEVTAHFASEPFSTAELEHKGVHTVVDSDDIVGKGFTTSIISATEKFYNENPKTVAVFLESITEANEWINTHSAKDVAKLYLKTTNSKEPVELIEKILLERADVKFTTKPTDITVFSDFLYKIGIIKSKPSQKELFFDEVFKDKYK